MRSNHALNSPSFHSEDTASFEELPNSLIGVGPCDVKLEELSRSVGVLGQLKSSNSLLMFPLNITGPFVMLPIKGDNTYRLQDSRHLVYHSSDLCCRIMV
jgi:hypothetical protein